MPKTQSLPRGVAMVGAGMSKFGTFTGKDSRDLFVEAFKEMNKPVDKRFDPSNIETLYIGNFSSDQFEHQAHIAPCLPTRSVSPLAPLPASKTSARLAVRPSVRV